MQPGGIKYNVNAKSPQFPEIDWVVKLYTACSITYVDLLILCILLVLHHYQQQPSRTFQSEEKQ